MKRDSEEQKGSNNFCLILRRQAMEPGFRLFQVRQNIQRQDLHLMLGNNRAELLDILDDSASQLRRPQVEFLGTGFAALLFTPQPQIERNDVLDQHKLAVLRKRNLLELQ